MAYTHAELLATDEKGNNLLQKSLLDIIKNRETSQEQETYKFFFNLISNAKKLFSEEEMADYINHKNKDGETVLYIACSHWVIQPLLVETLLELPGIDINAADEFDGMSPLIAACGVEGPPEYMKSKNDIINLLVKHPNININFKDIHGNTALSMAFQYSLSLPLISLLMSKPGIDLLSDGCYGANALMAASYGGWLPGVQSIIQAYEDDVTLTNDIFNLGHYTFFIPIGYIGAEQNLTPLQIACIQGRNDIVQALLAVQQVDLNIQSNDHSTALLYACETNRADIVDVLLNRQDIDANLCRYDGLTPLMAAIWNDMPLALILKLISKSVGTINEINVQDYTALDIAVHFAYRRRDTDRNISIRYQQLIVSLLSHDARRNQRYPVLDFTPIVRQWGIGLESELEFKPSRSNTSVGAGEIIHASSLGVTARANLWSSSASSSSKRESPDSESSCLPPAKVQRLSATTSALYATSKTDGGEHAACLSEPKRQP